VTTITVHPSLVIVTPPGGTVTTILEPPELNSPWPTWNSPPEPTITEEPDKELDNLAFLLFALRNRRSLLWTERKDAYIKNVDETHNDLVGLLSKIPNPPKANPACSKSKRKRDILEGTHSLYPRGLLDSVIDSLKNVVDTISCAVNVASNLANEVKLPEPPSFEIENLTEALEQLGNKLEEQKDDDPNETDNPTRSSNKPKPTGSSSFSSSACSASIASSCSASCVAGTTSSCTTVCATSTGCSVANTVTATTSTPTGRETPPPFAIIESHVDTFWVLGQGLSGEEQDKLYDEVESFLSEELQEETPTPTSSETPTKATPTDTPTEPRDLKCLQKEWGAPKESTTDGSTTVKTAIQDFCKERNGQRVENRGDHIYDRWDVSGFGITKRESLWLSATTGPFDQCGQGTINEKDCVAVLTGAMNACDKGQPMTFGAVSQGDGCIEYAIEISPSIHEGDPPWNQHVKKFPPPEVIRSGLAPASDVDAQVVCSKEMGGQWSPEDADAAIEEYCGNDYAWSDGYEPMSIKGNVKIAASWTNGLEKKRGYDGPYKPEDKDYCKYVEPSNLVIYAYY
jgi:hypothetical protein